LLRSMTGYGSSERAGEGRRIRAELKSVNQRFLDVQVKAPRFLLQVEDRIRQLVESSLARGRVTVYIDWRADAENASPTVNAVAAERLVKELRHLRDELQLTGDVDLGVLSRFPQVFENDAATPEADEVWRALEPVLTPALKELLAMRVAEGAELLDDFNGRIAAIGTIVDEIEKSAPAAAEAARERVAERVRTIIAERVPVDEARIAQELAILAERSDFTEEIVRLKAHLTHVTQTLSSDEPVGKRLNFLVQELHREANTIGSKTGDVGISSTVVSLKEEIEKLREQVQNVE